MNSVNDNIASLSLAQFDVPLNLQVINAGQAWPNRQKMAHAGTLGLASNDFHGLQDSFEQTDIYSSTNNMILIPAWKAIKQMAKRNRNLLMKMTNDPRLGIQVGSDLVKTAGFGSTFALPSSILENKGALSSSLK